MPLLLAEKECRYNKNYDNSQCDTTQQPKALVRLCQLDNLNLLSLLFGLQVNDGIHQIKVQPQILERLLFLQHQSYISFHLLLVSAFQIVIQNWLIVNRNTCRRFTLRQQRIHAVQHHFCCVLLFMLQISLRQLVISLCAVDGCTLKDHLLQFLNT